MDSENPELLEVFLQPGEFHFADAGTRISTVLGSCVAITLWHPALRQGGMCHYILPEQAGSRHRPDGRYADGALQLFMQALARTRTRPQEYEAKLFGGGRMFQSATDAERAIDIGLRNIERGRQLLREYGFRLCAEHSADEGHRSIKFDIARGDVWVRHKPERVQALSLENKKHGHC